MEIISNTLEFNIERDTAVAIGKFDGVHLGHKKLLDEIRLAKKRGLAACVFTFDKPISALFGKDIKVINTCEEKRKIFERMGVDYLVEFPLTLESAATDPEEFIAKYLVKQMNMKFIAAGVDISFGNKGLGDAKLLMQKASSYGYDVKIIDKVKAANGEEISSTLVRECIEKGDMSKAKSLLGTAYSYSGIVEHGNHLGSTIGFPTVNIYPANEKILPPFGVYKSRVWVDRREYIGISNIGKKPTVGDDNKVGIETYIYDFDKDVYGKEITVFIEKFMRPEQKFDSLEALKAQLNTDIENGRLKIPADGFNGIINVYKEAGFTSFDVVAKLRGICRQKKIGHTGTLDPDATGVLPVALGKATKVCELLTDHDKEYVCEMLLGIRTDTLDISGEVLERNENIVTDEALIRDAISSFIGEIEQVPPMYSALKVGGKKLCDLARDGITIDREARKITIYNIEVEDISLPVIKMRVSCSKGTYIRTLCDDIGEKVGCHATMKSLVRTKHSVFDIKDAHTISEIESFMDEGILNDYVIPVDRLFDEYGMLTVKEEAVRLLDNGNVLKAEDFENSDTENTTNMYRVYRPNGSFAGIYKYHERGNCYKPEKMFL